ncbi:NACHT and WD repeat domain-containing 2-like isoform 1 [Schistosoma japonicum]|uniref:NACHT and WD repeat domain-containing 2-like isoform 1 n=1 Tax=Schistosoma japonicum TaxID=6182 RepID=A0A4Z2D9T9_SCHJA|nr:NACHT and WD repeat domain-containing 2-like isoform 1 [Schistosoma japonicum]
MNYLLPLCQGRIRPDELPVISPRTIYFFVCSAYVDFSVERRVLQESTYHDVRKYSLEKYGLDVCFIDPRPLEDVVPLEHLGYSDLFRKLSLQYCRNDLNCCPIILLGQKYGLPLLPKRISSSTFDCIIYRMKQKTSNPYYRFIQDIDLSKWYYLNPNVLGEPEWNLNSMDYLGDKLENESFESRKKIIEEWNRERNIIAWVLHYIGNLCLRENLITEQDFNELAITEFPYTLSLLSKSTYVNYMNWTNDKRTINTDCMFSDPIVLQREIIDIQYYINDDSNTEKFIDIVPKLTPVDGKINGSQSYDTLEKQSVIDQSLQDNLQAVTKHLVEKLVNSNLKFEDQKLKVLWRSPNGIDRKFHKDYLLEFVERVKNLACNAIDKRASTKVSLMLPSLSIGRLDLQSDEIEESVENGDMPHTVSTPVITLPQVQNRHTYLARELQRHIGLWDRVWNSINYAGWLIPVASSYKNEIETLLCYIEDVDPTAQVPMLVYSTCETTDKLDKEQFCLANAVAACSFQEIQNRVSTNPSDYLLLIRIYTNPVLITDALLDLAEQISLILQIENDTLNTTTLASFLYSLSCLHMKHTPRSIVIVIGGIEHLEVSEYQESMEGLLPILQAKQLPRRLANGIKLILSGNLKLTKLKENVEGGEGAETEINDGILLPTTSLNLEVCSNGLSGGVTNCMHNLSKLNRCLTNEQLTCVHQLFQQISEEKNLPILACATGLCLLSDLPFQYMKRDDLVCKLIHTHLDDFISYYGKYFCYQTVKHLIYLLISVSNEKLNSPGATIHELQEMLSPIHEVLLNQTSQQHLKCNNTLVFDSACLLLLLHSIEKSLTSRLGPQNLICSVDGYFVYKLSTKNQLDQTALNIVGSMLKGYFLNEWFDKRKNPASLKSYKTSFHSIYFNTPSGSSDPEKENHNCDLRALAFNVRYLRQLSFCLLNTKDYYEFSYRTTFCFDWLYGKIYSIGVKSVLNDLQILNDMLSSLDDESNFTENNRVIRFESSIMQNILTQLKNSLYNNPDCLPTELLGYLVRFTSEFGNHQKQMPENENISLIDLLVRECEIKVTKTSYLLPLYSYPLTLGSPLLGQITCPTPLLSLHNLNQNNNEWKFNSQILIKLKNNPVIYRYDCQQGREISCWKSSSGYLYLTPNGKYAIIIDEEKRDTLKIHQIDIDINGCVPLIGQINPGLWIRPIWTKNPNKETLKMQIIFLDITDDYVAFIVQTRNTRSFLNPSKYIDYLDEEKGENFNSSKCDGSNNTDDPKIKDLVNKSIPLFHIPESLSAGTINHVVIFELTTGKPLHLISPSPCATLVKLVQVKKTNERTSDISVDGNTESINKSCDLFFFNSADHLFGFHLKSGEQQFSIDLQFVPRKILVSNNNQRLFILDSNNPYVLQLLINKLGHVSKSFRTSYDDLITKDNILDIKLSRYYSFLLIHAKKNVLVYDYENDAVFVHITRPAGIPREFRLPNSKYQNLVFTAVEFALNDQIVLAAIFRNILIWDVRQGVQLTTLTSSIGVISRLLVDPSEKQLICYISTSKILNLWNLPLALTNATLKQNSDINPISIHCDSNRMDCLTKPISQLIYSTSSNILLVTCYNSDELGVFDLSSGHLTDVFTHNGIVQSAVLSSCGKYALIGLVVNKQTEENANLIWDLSKRLIVVEYGNQVGFHVGRFKRCGSFLQLMPQLAPKNNGDSSQRYSYMILRVEIDISNTAENKATIIPVTSSKLPSIVPGSKPFMTFDDQHLIMQIESHEELKQGVNICQELALWSFDSSSENDSVVQNGKLWYTHTEELKTLLTGNKEYDLHILNCAPVQNMSTTIIVTFAKFNSLTKSYPSVNWKTGSGLSKGMILAEIVKANQGGQSKEWMLVILRSITGLNEWSSFQTLYYSFLKHELYISTTGNYYILPLGTKHVSQEYFKENVPHFTIQSKQSINSDSVKFHGYVLYDNLCIFSHRSTVYLVRPKSAKVITFIDVHHTVTTISKNPVSDQCLFIGTTDGYIISYCIVTDNNDLNNNDNDNVLTLKQIHLNMNTRAVENLDRNSNLYSTQDNKNDGKLLGRTNYYLPYKHMKPDDFKLYQHCGYFGERRSQTCSLI